MSPEQTGNPLFQMVPFLLVFLIFYVLVIRPEKDKQRQQKETIANVKKNDQVICAGGIHGTVVNVKTTTVVVRIDDNTKIEVEKDSIATVKVKA
ncbi:MAG: preprotein translocase subunit YajC [Candidatus Omnitrophota bacterium]|nr:preprotein translocase subunit YajC [Candidatus Omnitrophota bacterium]